MQDRQAEPFFAVGLHIPHMIAAPMEVVAPNIHLGLATHGNAIDIRAEHLAPIDQQPRFADAIMVIGGFAVIVGPEGEAYPAPCRKLAAERPNGMVLLGVGLAKAESLLGESTIKKSFSIHWNSHEGMGLRSYGVGNEMSQAGQRVAHHPGVSIVEFQMQMRSRGITGIAADGYQLTRLDGKLAWGETHLKGIAPSCALELFLVDVSKALQMTIYAG